MSDDHLKFHPFKALPFPAGKAIYYDKISTQMKNEKLNGQSMNNQRRFLIIFFVLTFFGVMSLLAIISSPAFENIRRVDVVRLIGTGMCWGGAIVSIVTYFRGRRSS